MKICRGFTLLELLVVLGLLGIFALIATRLLVTSMRAIDRSSSVQNTMNRMDSMFRTLRSDIWSANRIELIDAQSLKLWNPADIEIHWTIAADGTVTRSLDDLRWWPVDSEMRFERRGGSLVIALRGGDEIGLQNLMELGNQ